MKNILQLSNPNNYARHVHAPELHPLIAIVHYDEVSPVRTSLNRYGVYGLFIQRNFPKNLTYGMKMFDAADGSIIAVEPGQIGGKEDDGEDLFISGWALLFSPQLLRGTDLEDRIKDYPFFSYFATETLKMEPSEWGRISQLLTQLRHELQENEDSPALRAVVLGYLRLILEYCKRIYLRQLAKEDNSSSDILKRFHGLLRTYYLDGRQMDLGVPSVQYFAERLAYSPRYLGDVVHKFTGGTAIGYIHSFVIEQGKNLLMNGHNINETAHLLGFEYRTTSPASSRRRRGLRLRGSWGNSQTVMFDGRKRAGFYDQVQRLLSSLKEKGYIEARDNEGGWRVAYAASTYGLSTHGLLK